MATEKPSYTPTQWKNENEGGDVPDINAENLNHIEQGLKDIYDYAIEKLLNNDDFVSELIKRIVNTGTTSEAGYAADARQLNPNQSGSLAQQITQLKSDITAKNIISTDLNDFRHDTKPQWGFGYGVTNAPWTVGISAEYIPYSAEFGVQRVTSVQEVDGVYKTACRIYDNGVWQPWHIDDPNTNIIRYALSDTVDFNQFAITKEPDGKHILHFYKNGVRIGGVISA